MRRILSQTNCGYLLRFFLKWYSKQILVSKLQVLVSCAATSATRRKCLKETQPDEHWFVRMWRKKC